MGVSLSVRIAPGILKGEADMLGASIGGRMTSDHMQDRRSYWFQVAKSKEQAMVCDGRGWKRKVVAVSKRRRRGGCSSDVSKEAWNVRWLTTVASASIRAGGGEDRRLRECC